jgi:hypothetical protein
MVYRWAWSAVLHECSAPPLFQLPQAALEIDGIDRAQISLDCLRQGGCLAGGDPAARRRTQERRHRTRDVGGALDRRQVDRNRLLTVQSRHIRSAAGSPESAISTAFRADVSALPSSSIAAARVSRSVVSRGFPLGLPDCPFWNGRPPRPPLLLLYFAAKY